MLVFTSVKKEISPLVATRSTPNEPAARMTAKGFSDILEQLSLSNTEHVLVILARVFVSPSHQDPDQCGSTGHIHIAADADKNMYSTVLTAFTAGKQVSFYMSGCLTESGNNAPEITRVAIQ